MDSRDAGFGSGAIRGACSPVRGADSHGRGLFSAPAARRRGRCHLLSLYSSSILFAFRLSPHSVGGRPDTRVLPPSSAPAAFRELLRRVLGLLRSADPLAFDARHRVAPSETRPTAASMPRNILMTWKRNSARPTVARTDKGKVRSGAREPRPKPPVRSHASARAHVGCDAPHRGAHSLASLGETREDLVTLVHGEAIEDRSKSKDGIFPVRRRWLWLPAARRPRRGHPARRRRSRIAPRRRSLRRHAPDRRPRRDGLG